MMDLDRRTFLSMLAGSFCLKLLPLDGAAKQAVLYRGTLPKFDHNLIKWSPFIHVVDQAALVSRGVIDLSHTCKCGKVFHGVYTTAIVKERKFTREALITAKEEAKERGVRGLRHLWDEVLESELIRHHECPLQPEGS